MIRYSENKGFGESVQEFATRKKINGQVHTCDDRQCCHRQTTLASLKILRACLEGVEADYDISPDDADVATTEV